MRRAPAPLFLLAASLAAFALGSEAWAQKAPSKQACISAHSEGQAARKDGKLRSARNKFLLCSSEVCPGVIRKDCSGWLGEVEASLPTLVFEVKGPSGRDTSEVRIFEDGALLRESLDGQAVAVDPGERTFRFEIEGAEPREETVLVREGDKGRRVRVSFAEGGGGDDGDDGAAQAAAGPPAAAYVAGAVGLVGLASFATLGALGQAQKGDLEERCAPLCTDDEVSGVRTKFLVADVSLGVGVLGLGVAAYLFLSAPKSPPPAESRALRFDVRPTRRGGYATVGARF